MNVVACVHQTGPSTPMLILCCVMIIAVCAWGIVEAICNPGASRRRTIDPGS